MPLDDQMTSKAVRHRYGDISDMTLHRWLHDETLNFPKPVYVRSRRYWRVADLDAFDKTRRAMPPAAPPPPIRRAIGAA